MKRFILFLTIIFVVLLSGCSYKDMNRIQFTTMSIVDMNESGEFTLYSEHFVSDRGDSQESGVVERVVLMSKGKDVREAYSNTQPISPYPISYDVKKAIVFTENMATIGGLKSHVDLLERDQKITNKVFMFICEDDPKKILEVKMSDEKFTGIWLEDIMVFQKDESRILSIRSNQYLNNRLKGSKVNVLPIIKVEKQPLEDRIIISGAAIIIDDKMVNKLTSDDVPLYKLLIDELKKGRFPVENPHDKSKFISLEILNSKTKSNIEYNDDEITLAIDIGIVCSINGVEGELNLLDQKIRNEFIKATETTVKQLCIDLLQKTQKRGIDLLDVETKLRRKYSNFNNDIKYEDIVRDMEFKVNVDIKLDGSQNITYSLE